MKIENFSDVRDKELVRKLIQEEIDKNWVKELLLGRKGIKGDIRAGTTLADDFNTYAWDNLKVS